MITTNADSITLDSIPFAGQGSGSVLVIEDETSSSLKQSLVEQANNQLWLHGKFTTHNPKAGLNPLVDVAGYLFSLLGTLKHLKVNDHLSQLQKELTAEIHHFQEAVEAKGYRSEYTLVSRYALCATFDDVIANTSWGGQGLWDAYSLLTVFNSEGVQPERFFLILERIIKEPALYIDVMELMYVCLSLGYKGSYRAMDQENQLEKITHSLYKRICAYHGDFTRTLSPFPIRVPQSTKKMPRKITYGWLFVATAVIILLLFLGLGFMLDTISGQVYQALGS